MYSIVHDNARITMHYVCNKLGVREDIISFEAADLDSGG